MDYTYKLVKVFRQNGNENRSNHAQCPTKHCPGTLALKDATTTYNVKVYGFQLTSTLCRVK